ncbi:NAD(P)/FAD-dependent oxidoreductase [Candidatus Darwinibacter acetoxidans]|nr:FAD-dependent oxidoreductase [Bacillota bacterium]
MGKTILILGGGTAGTAAANVLADVLPPGFQLAVVDRSPDHLFLASLPLLIVGRRRRQHITRRLSALESRGLQFIHGEVEGLDLDSRTVLTRHGPLPFHALIIALGMERTPLLAGQREWAFNPFDLGEAEQLHARLSRFQGGRIVLFVSSLPFTGAVAPYEIMLLLHSFFLQRGLRSQVELCLLTPEQRLFSFAPPRVSAQAAELLSSSGIILKTATSVRRVTKSGSLVLADGKELAADLIIGLPHHHLPAALESSCLAGPEGWLKADPHTLETSCEDVYALGDVAGLTTSAGDWLPKVGFFAHYQAEVVARNLALKLSGQKPRFKFQGGAAGAAMLTGLRRGSFVSISAYSRPPAATLSKPNPFAFLLKTIFEKYWLSSWF